MKINLSQKQREIVEYVEGPLLVKAGPGSGKTRVIIERIKHLLSLHARTRILALTFSNLAADEMKNRIQEDLFEDELVNNVTLGTIHSFCLDIVQSRGHLIGLPRDLTLFESLEDRKKVLLEVIKENPELRNHIRADRNINQYLMDYLNIIANYKKAFVLPGSVEIPEINSLIYEKYNEALLIQGAIDFDDILFYAYRILSENKNVAQLYSKQYRFICVDEAQDLNNAQYQVIKAICGDSFKNIMLVGDENQSIYGFNGSDSSLMCNQFVNDFNPKVFILNENFRSAKSIVNFANTLENATDYSNCYYEGELVFTSYENEKDEASAVLKRIEFLLKNGHKDIEDNISYSDIAIIARNRYVFLEMESLFENKGIPFYFKRSATGIESESKLFNLFDLKLRLLSNPKDIIHTQELHQIENTINNENLINLVKEVTGRLNEDQFDLAPALRTIQDWAKDSDLDENEKYMILNDSVLWKEHWKKYSFQVQKENRTLSSFRNYVALGKTQSNVDETGISFLTAHMSKGLQYEIVFVIGLSEGTFPDYRAVQSGEKAMEQERNNMFVAVTRAKRLCYLSNAEYKVMPWGGLKKQIPSRFVKSLIEE